MLVTGADGVVGSYVQDVFPDYDLTLTDKHDLDVTDRQRVGQQIRHLHPTVVLHLAAATDVDKCERDPDWAYRTNAVGTENVALACRKAAAEMVYVSTAGVFRGDQREPYTEFDPVGPVNVYGRAKLAGERLASQLLPCLLTVRAGWMFGGGALDKKFVGKIALQIRDDVNAIPAAVDDKRGSPTYAKDLLQHIRLLLETRQAGVFHAANEGVATRYDVAKIVANQLMSLPYVVPCSSAEFPLAAPRADSEAMRAYKTELVGLIPPRPWQQALTEYLAGF